MEYFRVFTNAVGWNWVRIPGIVVSTLPVVFLVLRNYGWIKVDSVSNYLLAAITCTAIILWIVIGLLHHAVLQSRAVDYLQTAFDRTGKYNVPILKALEFIAAHYAKSNPTASQDSLFKMAANKIRELGFANEINISGYEFDSDNDEYKEFSKPILPQFWDRNALNLENIRKQNEYSHTIEDGAAEVQFQPEYRGITISERTLKAMFPDYQK